MHELTIPVELVISIDENEIEPSLDLIEASLQHSTAGEALSEALERDARLRLPQPEIHTNHRGFIGMGEHAGEPLDGHMDGWAWHAWQGPFIAYGATEADAIEHLKQKVGP